MRRPRFIALLLALITLVAYLPVAHNSFLDYDDNDYVTNNHVVQHGLTWAGVKWAFTSWHAANWHPLTWLSHMLDCELFGLNVGAQHYVNVLFHTANAVLLLLLLFRLTGALWPSAFIAALFAWHPLHVESVAWIAERKDVLSTFFEMLALLAYTRFVAESTRLRSASPRQEVRSPKSKVFYALALLMFALGLMAKPMLVTLPFLLLLLDYWPLKRISDLGFQISNSYGKPSTFNSQPSTLLRLTLEKWPFFLLSAASCVVTFLAQHAEAVLSLEKYPLNLRLGNALLSYVLYLGKAIWPAKLAVIYPLQNQLPWVEVAMAVVFLVVITWLVWKLRRSYPYLLVGWLWFLGTLVPVIGLMQVGKQAMADRYTYVPLIGIFLAVTFSCRDWAVRLRLRPGALVVAGGLILAGCLLATEHQLSYWKDDETLFRHALAVTKNNDVACVNLGIALEKQGGQAEALARYQEALRINSNSVQAHNNLGNLLSEMGKTDEALAQYQEALKLNPMAPLAHDNLGTLLVKSGRFDEAMSQYKEAAQLDPDDFRPHYLMGKALLKQGRDAGAIAEFHEALRLDPEDFQTLAFLACVLASDENPQIRDGKTALGLAVRANTITGGTLPFVFDALGMACAETGDFTNAEEAVQKAIDLAIAARMEKLEPLQQRLELYKKHQPWRESFLATNASPATPQKN